MENSNNTAKRKLRMGMVGGDFNAFIGGVHRKALALDGQIELVAGAFSHIPEYSHKTGEMLMLDPARVHDTYQDFLAHELTLPADQRVDFVSIVTPNFTHFDIAKAFLNAGINVYCEKPMTMTSEEAAELVELTEKTGLTFGLNHNYTGYPMVKLAKDFVQGNKFGKVRKVRVQYPQGWLATPIDQEGQMQAEWRTDPKKAGAAGCVGDIGSHAANLAEYITGLRIDEVCAELTSFVPGRRLDDDGNMLLRFEGGARGVLVASQISVGAQNELAIWVHCEEGTVEWHQEHPEELTVYRIDQPDQIWHRGNGYVAEASEAAARATRLPGGHPEGFFEAMANLYVNFADTLRAKMAGETPSDLVNDFPDVVDGLDGMRFIETAVESSNAGAVWKKIPQ